MKKKIKRTKSIKTSEPTELCRCGHDYKSHGTGSCKEDNKITKMICMCMVYKPKSKAFKSLNVQPWTEPTKLCSTHSYTESDN